VEEQYYLIWPLILILLPTVSRTRVTILILLVAVCVASASGALHWLGLRPIETAHAVWHLPATSYAAILIGSLLAVLLHSRRGFTALHALLGWRWSPVMAFAVLVAMFGLLPANLLGLPYLAVHLTMAICLATLVVREDHALKPFLAWRPVARVGVISYGLYLYHLVGLDVANRIIGRLDLSDTWAVWIVTLSYALISIVIAEISFRTLERYFLSLKTSKKARRGRLAS
jgi:peptidoglycan/LPS O-acetylase OafA/YrhL